MPRTPDPSIRRFATVAGTLAIAFAGLATLNGCGAGSFTKVTGGGGSTGGGPVLSGKVQVGATAVSGATLTLYAAGTGGNGAAAKSILTSSTLSASDGTFTLSGTLSCASGKDQIYVLATGGSPGLTSSATNHALSLVAAIGSCSQLTGTTVPSVVVNELTTVAAAYTLAPFTTSATAVSSSSTNAAGMANAFLNAALLANATTGQLATLSSAQVVETAKLSTLANILHACAASDGTTACSPLFTAATPSGGSAPSDTFSAALDIVRHPGNNVATIYAAAPSTAAFSPALTAAPTDWTMTLNVTGGGMQFPRGLALDASGNVWVVSQPGVLSGFSPQGIAMSATGYGTGVLSGSFGIAVDASGNIWATNFYAGGTLGSLTEFNGATSSSPGSILQHSGSNFVVDSTMDFPIGVAASKDGHLYIADYNNSTASIYLTSGTFVAGNLGVPQLAAPVAVAGDGSGGFWIANNDRDSTSVTGTVTHLASDGSILANPNCCDTANGVAVDQQANAWVANYGSGSVSAVSATGATILHNTTNGGLTEPAAIAVDAGNNVWVTNYYATTSAGTITELAGNSGTATVGTGITPAYVSATQPGGYGLDVKLSEPISIAPDFSGDLWVSSFGTSHLTMFFGLATPTATPLLGLPAAP